MENLIMTMTSVGNPDFGQTAEQSPQFSVIRNSLWEMKIEFERYRDHFDLGGGNFGNVKVHGPGRKCLGMFSYNGRFWAVDSKGNKTDKEIKIKEPKKASTYKLNDILSWVVNDYALPDHLLYLRERWGDEKDYEDFNDYAENIRKYLKRFSIPLVFIKATKRPFGFHAKVQGRKIKFALKAKGRGYIVFTAQSLK